MGEITYKIADLGSSKLLRINDEEDDDENIYKPPEDSAKKKMGSDRYGLGVILYELSIKMGEKDKKDLKKKMLKKKEFISSCKLQEGVHIEHELIQKLITKDYDS